MTSKTLIEAIKRKYKELEHKGWEWRSFYNGALEGFSIASGPKHETVSDWEKRTGMEYPEDGPIWCKDLSGKYYLGEYRYMSIRKNYCIVANHHGKPE
jgi:hypothetical protein